MFDCDAFDEERLTDLLWNYGLVRPRYISDAIGEYKKYLLLCRLHGELYCPAVIEEVWKMHITDTQKYMQFCDAYFGYYLHRDPVEHEKTKEPQRTQELYEKAFKEKPTIHWYHPHALLHSVRWQFK